MKWQKMISEAIKEHKMLSITYDGEKRKVAPHIFGLSPQGNFILSSFQIKNFNHPLLSPEWRTFDLSKVTLVQTLDETFYVRRDYNPDDENFDKIIWKV